ncbi:organic cation/carnitine transporter 2-like [Tripterygium wilfordii]|nr:organic cation/carnitine transporter 2-like [Tripterygium wilfordii]XP_038721794.1 organic cation/carnitine transporter 2-like [Tripterygium wilfordii]
MLELPRFGSAKKETNRQDDETYKQYYKLNREDSADTERTKEVEPTFPSLDKMMEQSIGTFGLAQLVQAVLVAFSSFFDSQQTFISIFTDAHPKWHCTNDSICNSDSNICQLPKSAWAWDGPSTMVSEWDLGCAGSFITGLPASAYFMGSLLGGFFLATIADSSIGRKKFLFLSCLAMAVTTALTAFSTNIWVYSVLRFISGVGRVPIGTCNIVLLTEKVGKEWRGRVGVMEELLFTLGFLSLPGVAYINRGSSWRSLYLWTSIPTLIYCLIIQFFVSESPRWLFTEGRYEEAIKVLKTISPSMDNPMLSLYPLDNRVLTRKTSNTNPSSMIRKLFKKKWALQRIVALLIPGFCIGLGYFGMALGLGNLDMNLYLSVTYNAALEIPSSFLTFLMIEKWSRKGSLFTLCFLSGISGIMTTVAGNGAIQMGLELVSFFCACTAYNVILIYTVELFPTCVRNFAMTAVRQTLIFGAMFGPVLVASWRNNELLSYRVFGALLLFSGFFIVRLPETKGMSLADTLDEQEHNDNMVV